MLVLSVFVIYSIFQVTLSGPVQTGGHHDAHHDPHHDPHHNTSQTTSVSHGHAHVHIDHTPGDTYNITLSIWSGKSDPKWTLPRPDDLPNKAANDEYRALEQRILETLIEYIHSMTPAEANAVLPTLNGYRGLEIKHINHKGEVIHTVIIPMCKHEILEWNLIIKTAPETAVTNETKAYIHGLIWECIENPKTAGAQAADNTTTSATV